MTCMLCKTINCICFARNKNVYCPSQNKRKSNTSLNQLRISPRKVASRLKTIFIVSPRHSLQLKYEKNQFPYAILTPRLTQMSLFALTKLLRSELCLIRSTFKRKPYSTVVKFEQFMCCMSKRWHCIVVFLLFSCDCICANESAGSAIVECPVTKYRVLHCILRLY